MRSSRQLPLMWLFLVATAGVDALGWGGPTMSGWFWLYLFHGVLTGQLWLAGSWLILGNAHRLARAAVWVVATVCLATMIGVSEHDGLDNMAASWGRAFAGCSLMTGAAAAGATLIIVAAYLRRRHTPSDGRMRFPVVELFGWTMVVAVASWAIGAGAYEQMFRHRSVLFAIASSAVAGMAAALFQIRSVDHVVKRLFTFVAIAAALLACFAFRGAFPERDLYFSACWGYAYLAASMFVSHLDREAWASTQPLENAPTVIR